MSEFNEEEVEDMARLIHETFVAEANKHGVSPATPWDEVKKCKPIHLAYIATAEAVMRKVALDWM